MTAFHNLSHNEAREDRGGTTGSSDGPSRGADATGLDERVNTRLDTLLEFARAVAHELGGTMLPSQSDTRGVGGSDQMRRLRFQMSMISDHLVSVKRSLDLFRSGPGGMDDRIEAGEWWDMLRPLMRGAAGGQCQIVFQDEAPDELVDSTFTRIITLITLTLLEQAAGVQQLTLTRRGTGAAPQIVASLQGEQPLHLQRIRTPERLTRWLHGEPQCDTEAGRVTFTLDPHKLALSTRG